MPSPFPGMDPWLEREPIFSDFHDRFLMCLSEAINALLPDGYFSATNTIVWDEENQRREPDVSLFGKRESESYGVALAEVPGLTMLAELEEIEQRFLEIRTGDNERLVTAIELLSPANKAARSHGRKAYMAKQEELAAAGVTLVEFDFLRAGLHTTLVKREHLERLSGSTFDYHVAVTQFRPNTRFHGAAIRLCDRLPTIGLPLDRGVPPVIVDLQAVLDRAYDTGRYSQCAKYARPCDPPLSPEQQAWADVLLRAKGVL